MTVRTGEEALGDRTTPEGIDPTEAGLLSIVITSYTPERLNDISELLASIKAQTYPRVETIFVADRSPELAESVRQHSRRIALPVRVILNRGKPGVNGCRNIGIRAARGEIVGLVDDDAILLPDWAEAMMARYSRDPAVVALTGPTLPLWEDEAMSWFPREFYWMWGCTVWDWNEVRPIRNVGGMNCSFRREALRRVDLYRPGLGPNGGEEKVAWFHPSGEEVELCLRLRKHVPGARIMWDPGAKVYHKVQKVRFAWAFMMKRAFRFGYSKRFVEELYGADSGDEPVLALERDHLMHILLRMPLSLVKELPHRPAVAWRRLLVAITGTLFSGLGYMAYPLRPYAGARPGSGPQPLATGRHSVGSEPDE